MAPSINIALVDDHKILMDGVESLLSLQDGLQVQLKCESGEQLLQQDLSAIDVVVMDINMEGRDGIQILKELTASDCTSKTILLSTYDDLKLVNEAFESGARGYMTKSNASNYLADAIFSVHKGDLYHSPDIKEKILNRFSGVETEEDMDAKERAILRQLTAREIDVLKLISMQYTSQEIAEQLFIAKSTVDTHRKNLIQKLKVKNVVGLGLFAERNELI
jgi:DNA-binding NarL/FixJ family response regulator